MRGRKNPDISNENFISLVVSDINRGSIAQLKKYMSNLDAKFELADSPLTTADSKRYCNIMGKIGKCLLTRHICVTRDLV